MHHNVRRGIALLALIGALSAVPYTYSLYSSNWPQAPVQYYVNTANLDVTDSEALAAIMAGSAVWSTQSNANFSFDYVGQTNGTTAQYNATNEVMFRNETSGNAIATAYTWSSGGNIVDSDIIFWDGAFQFFTGSSGCSGGFYIEDIAAHEFGHSAGIGHSTVNGTTMYPSVSYCSQNARTLAPDDIAAIEAQYPPASQTQPPAAPISLTAAPGSSDPTSTIELTWLDMSSDEDVFAIERSTGGSTFSYVGQTGANATSYADQNLSSATMYSYRVIAGNSGGNSSPSNTASAETDPQSPVAPPSSPSVPTPGDGATGVDRNADLSWSGSADTDTFDVYFGTNTPPDLYRAGVTASNLKLRKLSSGTLYFWKVIAFNSGGSAESALFSFTTAGGGSGGGGGGGNGNGRKPK